MIETVKDHEDVEKLPGKLYNIEQHSDGVTTEFSFNYIQEDGSYNRYFVIKEIEGKKHVHYMGSDSTAQDPKDNLFFKPTDPLSKKDHENKYLKSVEFIEEDKNVKINKARS